MDTINIIRKIKNNFLENKINILNMIKLEKKNWDCSIEFDEFLKIFDKYENNSLKDSKEIFSEIGNVAIINQENPYAILSMALISIRTNNKMTVYLKDKLLGINTVLIEIINKVTNDVKCFNISQNSDFYTNQYLYDLVIYFGNKYEYINFTKGLKINSIFENYGEVYVFIDDKSFKDEFISMDKFAYYNNIDIKYYNNDLDKAINNINNFGIVKYSVIYTKNREYAKRFVKEIKAENVFVNKNPFENYEFDFDEIKLMYSKKVY